MKLLISGHALRRMVERSISPDVVRSIVEAGTVIIEYPDDKPYPSRLLLGWDGERPVHVVAAHEQDGENEYIITVYVPDATIWNEDYTRRRAP